MEDNGNYGSGSRDNTVRMENRMKQKMQKSMDAGKIWRSWVQGAQQV